MWVGLWLQICGLMWVKFVVGSLLCSERFFCGFSGYPLSSKINMSKFQFDQMQDLPENLFRVNVINYYCFILVCEGDREIRNMTTTTTPGSSTGKQLEVFMLNANEGEMKN